jgi:hypothetical protein
MTPRDMAAFERAVVGLDQYPWFGLLRVVLGYAIVPTWMVLTSGNGSGWTLVPFVLGILVALRLVPAVLRKLLRFGRDAQRVWYERRQLAKRFDSYQWQKLFWVGLGMTAYVYSSSRRPSALMFITWATLLSGALGQLIWLRRSAQLRQAIGPGEPAAATTPVALRSSTPPNIRSDA